MHKVIHLVPYDGIGGVETAARSLRNLNNGSFDFKVGYIFKKLANSRRRWATFNPIAFLRVTGEIVLERPDVLIVSLWRSTIIGVLAKLIRPNLKLIVFIHSTTDVHWLDFIFTRLAISLAHEIWADSQATRRERLPHVRSKKCRIISFVTRHIEALPARSVRPEFIFWGRITPGKRLDRALRIFAEVLKRHSNARFWIIGPDGGCRNKTQQLCTALNLTEAVSFLGVATQDEIAAHAKMASFYLQTSEFEGMAMSVVEAMQMGLIPVVTAVGEICSYCRQGENAVLVESDYLAIETILLLLDCDAKYQAMRRNAIATWNNKPRYSESVLHACEEILAANRRV